MRKSFEPSSTIFEETRRFGESEGGPAPDSRFLGGALGTRARDSYVELIHQPLRLANAERPAWRPGGLPDLRLAKGQCAAHAILYFERTDSIEILRVLHQQMDFAAQLGVETDDQ